MKGFLDYVPGKSFLHKLNPLTKLIIALCICISCFISLNHYFLVAVIVMNLALSACAGILERSFSIFKGLVKMSVFLLIIQLLLVRRGNIVLDLPLGLIITDQGISSSLLVVLKLISATMPLAVMLSCTQLNDLSNVLVTKLFIPYKYAFALTTAIRFIPVFTSEMAGIIEAQTSRGVEFDTKNVFKKMKLILPLCVPLLMTSVKKTESSAISAEVRGFYLRTRKSCYKSYPMRLNDFAGIVFSAVIIALAVII